MFLSIKDIHCTYYDQSFYNHDGVLLRRYDLSGIIIHKIEKYIKNVNVYKKYYNVIYIIYYLISHCYHSWLGVT